MPDLEEINWELAEELPSLISTETRAVESLVIADYNSIMMIERVQRIVA